MIAALATLVITLAIAYLQRQRIHALELIAGYQLTRMASLIQALHGRLVILDQTEDGKLRCIRLNLLDDTDDNADTNTKIWRVSNN